ncbi:adhesin, partial [Variovorax sp. 2RAF20]
AENSVAVGRQTFSGADGAVAIGAISNVENGATAGTALGFNSRVRAAATNSVALGADSDAQEADVISVGNSGMQRRIVNV